MAVSVRDSSSRKRIKRTCNDIVHQTEWATSLPDFPPDGVAIDANVGGDELVLLPSATDPTRLQDIVYWWDYETGVLEKVAEDFCDLRITERRQA